MSGSFMLGGFVLGILRPSPSLFPGMVNHIGAKKRGWGGGEICERR